MLPRDSAWDNNDLGVALGFAKVRTTINFSIFAQMGHMRCLLAFMERVDVDGVIVCWVQRPYVEVMEV